jgi:hypothetical protein
MIGTELKTVHLDDISFKHIATVRLQAGTWDTLGYILLAKGDAAKAVPYLESAWKTYQNRTVADHLIEAYEKVGMQAKAATIKSLLPAMPDQPPQLRPGLHPSRMLYDRTAQDAQQRLQDLRTIRMPNPAKASVGLEFFVSILPNNKVDEVKLLRDDSDTQPWQQKLKTLQYPAQFPDTTETKIIRRGVLSCSTLGKECMVVLTPPDTMQTLN